MNEPLTVYGAWLRGETEGSAGGARVRLRDGTVRGPMTQRWVGSADAVDERALRDLEGPVLDVGCGPGRHLHVLARRGIFGLGVDLSSVAVGMARGAGSRAIVASVFDELPQSGEWRSALLLDGNIGIGGDPTRLLNRVGELLAPGGQIVVELAEPGMPTGPMTMRLEIDDTVSSWFPWAEVAATDIVALAAGAGLRVLDRWHLQSRWFAHLCTGPGWGSRLGEPRRREPPAASRSPQTKGCGTRALPH
jgi:SAM-dependent methyltransferase